MFRIILTIENNDYFLKQNYQDAFSNYEVLFSLQYELKSYILFRWASASNGYIKSNTVLYIPGALLRNVDIVLFPNRKKIIHGQGVTV
jgi:hypothetical protein